MSTDLRALLLDVARLYADLEDGLHGVKAGKAEGGSGTKVEAPLPLDADVVEHRHLLLRGLRYWTAKVHATPKVLALGTVPHLVAWLASEVDTLSVEDQAELRENLTDWKAGVAGRMDLPTLRGSLHLGKCPNADAAEWTCTGGLRVMLPADKARSPWLSCTGCKQRWNVTDLPAAADVALPIASIAALVKIPEGTLKSRIHYGNLELASESPRTVRLGDVLRSECAETV